MSKLRWALELAVFGICCAVPVLFLVWIPWQAWGWYRFHAAERALERSRKLYFLDDNPEFPKTLRIDFDTMLAMYRQRSGYGAPEEMRTFSLRRLDGPRWQFMFDATSHRAERQKLAEMREGLFVTDDDIANRRQEFEENDWHDYFPSIQHEIEADYQKFLHGRD